MDRKPVSTMVDRALWRQFVAAARLADKSVPDAMEDALRAALAKTKKGRSA